MYYINKGFCEKDKLIAKEIQKKGKIAGFYTKAQNQFGKKMGKHEVLSFKFNITNK